MSRQTWFRNESEYCLDYVCINDKCMICIQEACVLNLEDVIESDHCAIYVKVEWKVTKRDAHKRKIRERKKRLNEDRWEEYGDMVLERMSEVLADMNKVMMTK